MEAKIIFKDGTTIIAEINGDCYILNTKPEFPEDLSEVTIESQENIKVLHDAILNECYGIDNRYWFNFCEESAYDKTIRELKEENKMLEDAIIELADIIGR